MSMTTTIKQEAAATLKRLEAKDPGLRQLLKEAYAYAVFPSVGKAALVVGGAYGKGAVFDHGKFIGYATIGQTTIGVQIGGDTFTELIVFENRQGLDRLKQGKLSFAADASAVLVKAGAAAAKGFGQGTRAFVYGEGGMLLEAAIGGQKFKFKPAGHQEEDEDSDEKSGKGARNGRGHPEARGKRDRGESRDQREDDSAEHEQDEDQDEDQEQPGVMAAVSKVTGLVKEHPIAATIVSLAAAAAVAIMAVRIARSSAAGQDAESAEDEHEEGEHEDSESEMSRADDQEYQDDQEEEGRDDADQGDEEESPRFAKSRH